MSARRVVGGIINWQRSTDTQECLRAITGGEHGDLNIFLDGPRRIWAAGRHWRAFLPSVVMIGIGKSNSLACNPPRRLDYATGCALMMRRGVLDASEDFVTELENYIEDFAFSYRVCQVGFRIGYVPVARLQEIDMEGSAVFAGRVSAAEAPLYFRRADVLVDLVIDDLVERTRLPLNMFQSWASQVTFLTFDAGNRWMVLGSPPSVQLAEPRDQDSLADAIVRVLQDNKRAQLLVRLGSERLNQYFWEVLAQTLDDAYHPHGKVRSVPNHA